MKLRIYSNHCKAEGEIQELKELRDLLTFDVPGAKYTKLYRHKQWDGKKRLFNLVTKTFPVGLVDYVIRNVKMKLDIINMREYPVIDYNLPNMNIELRDYQIKAVQQCLKYKNCIIESATNSGKTAMFACLVKKLREYDTQILIVIHREEILKQIIEMVGRYTGLKIGFIQAKDYKLLPITVGMVATMVNRIGVDDKITEFYEKANCIIVDEAHHCINKSITSLLMASNAIWRFGFSGTVPDEDTYNGIMVRRYLGSVVLKVSNEEMILKEVSAKPIVYIYEMDLRSSLYGVFDDAKLICEGDTTKKLMQTVYQLSMERGIVHNVGRNDKILEIIGKNVRKSVLIVVDLLEHGEIVRNLLIQNNIEGKFISGSSENRQTAFTDFKLGKLKILISTNIIDEGVDISKIDVIIMLAGKKSKRQLLQRVGRGLRRKKGENIVRIYDFIDYGSKYLMKHSKKRLKIYKEEGFEINFI